MVLSEQRTSGLMAAEKFSLPVEEITKRIVVTYRCILYFFVNEIINYIFNCQKSIN